MDVGAVFLSIGGDLSPLRRSMQIAESMVGNLQAAVDRATSGSRILAGGLTAVGTAAAGAAMKAVQLAGSMEQSQVAFGTLLGSSQKAKAFLDNLFKFSSSTPFEFEGVQQSSKLLLAFGFQAKQVIPTLTAVGNASSALGAGTEGIDRIVRALGQMQAKGKVSAEEMQQLAELGVPAWDMLAKTIGTSIPNAMKLSEKGAIPAARAVQGLIDQMQARYRGMMDAQSKTLLGIWSNTVDNAKGSLTVLGDEIARITNLKQRLKGVTDWFGDLSTVLKTSGVRAALDNFIPPALRRNIALVAGAISGMLVPSLLVAAKAFFLTTLPLLPFAAAGVLITKNWDKVKPLFERLSPVIDIVKGKFQRLFAPLNDVMTAMSRNAQESASSTKRSLEEVNKTKITPKQVSMGDFRIYEEHQERVAKIVETWNSLVFKLKPVEEFFTGMVSKLAPVKDFLSDLVKPLIDSLQWIQDQASPILDANVQSWRNLIAPLELLGKVLGGGVLVGLGLIVTLLNSLLRTLPGVAQMFAGLSQIVTGFAKNVISLLKGDFKGAAAGASSILKGFKDIGGGARLAGEGMGSGIIEGIQGFLKAAKIDASIPGILGSVKKNNRLVNPLMFDEKGNDRALAELKRTNDAVVRHTDDLGKRLNGRNKQLTDTMTKPFRDAADEIYGHSIVPDTVAAVIRWWASMDKPLQAIGERLDRTLLSPWTSAQRVLGSVWRHTRDDGFAVWGNLHINIPALVRRAVREVTDEWHKLEQLTQNGIKMPVPPPVTVPDSPLQKKEVWETKTTQSSLSPMPLPSPKKKAQELMVPVNWAISPLTLPDLRPVNLPLPTLNGWGEFGRTIENKWEAIKKTLNLTPVKAPAMVPSGFDTLGIDLIKEWEAARRSVQPFLRPLDANITVPGVKAMKQAKPDQNPADAYAIIKKAATIPDMDTRSANDLVGSIFNSVDKIKSKLSQADWDKPLKEQINKTAQVMRQLFPIMTIPVSLAVAESLYQLGYMYKKAVGNSIIPDMVTEIGSWMGIMADDMPKKTALARAATLGEMTKLSDMVEVNGILMTKSEAARMESWQRMTASKMRTIRDDSSAVYGNMNRSLIGMARRGVNGIYDAYDGLGTAIIHITDDTAKNTVESSTDMLNQLKDSTTAGVEEVIAPYKSMFDRLSEWWNNLPIDAELNTRMMQSSVAGLVELTRDSIVGNIKDTSQNIIDSLKESWDKGINPWRAAWDALTKGTDKGAGIIKAAYQTIKDALWNTVIQSTGSIGQMISAFRGMGDEQKKLTSNGMDELTAHNAAWKSHEDVVKTAAMGIATSITDYFDNLRAQKGKIDDIGKAINGLIANGFDPQGKAIQNLKAEQDRLKLATGIAWNDIKHVTRDATIAVLTAIEQQIIAEKALQAVKDLWIGNWVGFFTNGAEMLAVTAGFEILKNAVYDAFPQEPVDKFAEAIQTLGTELNRIQETYKTLGDTGVYTKAQMGHEKLYAYQAAIDTAISKGATSDSTEIKEWAAKMKDIKDKLNHMDNLAAQIKETQNWIREADPGDVRIPVWEKAIKNYQAEIDAIALAKGGIVTKPTFAIVGEAGPEAVIPLGRGRNQLAAVGAGGGDIHLHISGNYIMDDASIDRFGNKLVTYLKRKGVRTT